MTLETLDTRSWVPLVDCETFVSVTLREAVATTWADGHGIWHTAIRQTCVAPLLAARRALRDELVARDPNVARDVWLHPVVVDRLGDVVVYREGNVPVVEDDILPVTFWDKDGDTWNRVGDTDRYTSPAVDNGHLERSLKWVTHNYGPITLPDV